MIQVHPAQTSLRGDERYNPRFTQQPDLRPGDGATRITGVMHPDSPTGVKTAPPLPDIPFRLIVPADADYSTINFELWQRLQSGESLWDLDFTPPQPPTHVADSDMGFGLVAAFALFAIGLAFGSRN